MEAGISINWKTFLYESVMSFIVALTVWAIMDQLFKVDTFVTYMTCAWAGIMSQKFEDKIELVFDKLVQSVISFLDNNEKRIK